MKICFIAPASNYHTKKWCDWFRGHGHQIDVISFTQGDIEGCTVHFIDSGAGVRGSDTQKLKYLLQAGKVHKLVKQIKPDVINVHYATSYGTVAALAMLPPYYLSVWGSDVYDFPNKSILHRFMLKFSMSRATYLFSTSKAMAKEASKYTKKEFMITPFGVDCSLFSSDKTRVKKYDEIDTKDGKNFVIGTVKSLSDKYGIATLLRATALFRKEHPEVPLQLIIAGKGPQEEEYKALARKLKIDDITSWLGFIPQDQAAIEWANMDCAIIPSELESESFGVSAVEAQACETPVIISDIPGLMEATEPGKTSVVVKRKNTQELEKAIWNVFLDTAERKRMGCAGRQYVKEHFELNYCFKNIESIYIENTNGLRIGDN